MGSCYLHLSCKLSSNGLPSPLASLHLRTHSDLSKLYSDVQTNNSAPLLPFKLICRWLGPHFVSLLALPSQSTTGWEAGRLRQQKFTPWKFRSPEGQDQVVCRVDLFGVHPLQLIAGPFPLWSHLFCGSSSPMLTRTRIMWNQGPSH